MTPVMTTFSAGIVESKGIDPTKIPWTFAVDATASTGRVGVVQTPTGPVLAGVDHKWDKSVSIQLREAVDQPPILPNGTVNCYIL